MPDVLYEGERFQLHGCRHNGDIKIAWRDPAMTGTGLEAMVMRAVGERLSAPGPLIPMTDAGMAELAMLVRQTLEAAESKDGDS